MGKDSYCKYCKKTHISRKRKEKQRGGDSYSKLKVDKIKQAKTIQEIENLNPAYRVRIFFIRHGQSCANLAKMFNVAPTHVLYRDPELTLNGINNSMKNGAKFKEWLKNSGIKLHYIGSSALIRSIETAYYMFRGDDFFQETNNPNFESKLIVCPYITELHLTPDNVPLSFEEQKDVLKLTMKESFDNLTKNISNEAYRVEQRVRSSLPDFLEWFEKKVPELFRNYGRKKSEGFLGGDSINPKLDPSKDTLNIGIVCHSGFINKYINNGTFAPYTETYNNSVFVKSYLFQSQPAQINYGANKEYPKGKDENCPNRCRYDPIQCERKNK